MTFEPLELFLLSGIVAFFMLVLSTVFEDFRYALVLLMVLNAVCFMIGLEASMLLGVCLICVGFLQQLHSRTRKYSMAPIAMGFCVALLSYHLLQK